MSQLKIRVTNLSKSLIVTCSRIKSFNKHKKTITCLSFPFKVLPNLLKVIMNNYFFKLKFLNAHPPIFNKFGGGQIAVETQDKNEQRNS